MSKDLAEFLQSCDKTQGGELLLMDGQSELEIEPNVQAQISYIYIR